MIPVSISMEGFLPYRERQELNFSGANLWMLSGRNGAGKSSVFDAITFALYGDGRYGDGGGTQQDYISHGATEASVAFDFDLGERRYRIKRMISHSASTALDVFELDRAAGQEVATVAHGVRAGTQWIEKTLGLNCETFSAAVLLRQGRRDALLSAKDSTRKDMMNQIIDLGAYERMQGLINKQANKLDAEVDLLKVRLTTQETATRKLASKIVKDFALDTDSYPIGETWHETANQLISALQDIETEAGKEAERLAKREIALRELQTHLTGWTTHAQSRADLLWKRAAYAAILGRSVDIEQRAARLKELTLTIPPRANWCAARKNWRTAEEKRRAAEEALQESELLLGTLEAAQNAEQSRLDTAKTAQEQAAVALAAAEQHLKTREERAKQLNAAQNKPNCMVCGKPLTAEEVAAELARLIPEIAIAKENADTAEQTLKDAKKAVAASEKEVKRLADAIKSVEVRIAGEKQKIALALKDREQAEREAQTALDFVREAWRELSKISVNGKPYAPENIAARLCPSSFPPTGGADCLRDLTYPDAQEMTAAAHEKGLLQGADKELTQLEEARKDVTAIDGSLEQVEADLVTDGAHIRRIAGEQDISALLHSKAQADSAAEAEISGYAEIAAHSDAALRAKNKTASDKRGQKAFASLAQLMADTLAACAEAKNKAATRRDNARDNRLEMAGKLADYADTAEELRVKRQEARVYRTLETKLDGKNLQSHLRVQAETAITANANTVLQRLSDGLLCLELLANTPRALDLRVIDREKKGRAMPTAGLSGSQKFRVSVALAIGIGQYACGMRQGGVESVIIDEGFGALDKEGQEKMINELYGLEKVLKRVIVVSHQEAFQTAFPNQWHVYMDGDTARARMQTG